MRDTRAFTKQANELMTSGQTITLRKTLKNGNIAERVFTPVVSVNENYRIYTDKMIVYQVNNNEILMHHTESYPSTTTDKGVLSTVLETLLISGYEVYNKQ